ncbi:MAG: flagellar basal body P-ring formation chaperone FlgA [Rhodovarius sp.]|nr:flagellar basal body P-ring formation chaperone FlgA [Rhodovarius sp.]MCX7933042.1 flagellar basal body P-ring formation chaperone FlgA [Rhodovarius sp.]MDW8314242.1 flagellar basal body P-ring formation chaperone FlgA [Rhodovarius sp.]
MPARRILLAGFLAAAAAPVAAQQGVFLRPLVLVEDPVLRLQDLFENAGPRGATPLGPAPEPGRRIVVEAPQLAAIARLHGLSWRPVSGQERAVIERPGRALPRAEIEALLREELAQRGLDPLAEIELTGFQPPMVPIAARHHLMLEGVTVEQPGSRFAATLVVSAEGMAMQRLRIAGRAVPTLPVVLANRRLALGEVIGPADVREVRLRAERVRPGLAERAEQVLGRELRRPVGADTPLPLADLGPPSLVQRHQPVLLVLEAPGLQLTAQGRALGNAARGEVVAVMNIASRAVLEGEVIGPGRVRIAHGSIPRERP